MIRGGAGIYWDSTPGYYKLREAAALGPPGSARNTLSASAFTNIYPGIYNLSAGGTPIPVGAPLPINALTNMTVGLFQNLVNTELPAVSALLAPSKSAEERDLSLTPNCSMSTRAWRSIPRITRWPEATRLRSAFSASCLGE